MIVCNYDLQLYNQYLTPANNWKRIEFETKTSVGSKKIISVLKYCGITIKTNSTHFFGGCCFILYKHVLKVHYKNLSLQLSVFVIILRTT